MTSVPLRIVLVAVFGIAATVVGLTGSHYLPTTSKPTAKSPSPTPRATAVTPTATEAPPLLLRQQDVAPIASLVSAEQDQTTTTLASWWDTHGTVIDDDAFVAWAATQIPAPPGSIIRNQELTEIATRIRTRTSADVKAARWLDSHADASWWPSMLKQQAALHAAGEGIPTASELRAAVDMATRIAKLGSEKVRLPAPQVVNVALRDNQETPSSTSGCPCSYPSQIIARSAAARRYLGDLATHRRAEYQWFESQVDTGQMLRGQVTPSDIAASAFVGDLVGQYVLVTRGHIKP